MTDMDRILIIEDDPETAAAVRLEAGYLSSTCDRARLEEPHTRQLVAESVAEAIHDFFGPA